MSSTNVARVGRRDSATAGAVSLPSFHAHQLSVRGLRPARSQKTAAVSPLARQARTCSHHFARADTVEEVALGDHAVTTLLAGRIPNSEATAATCSGSESAGREAQHACYLSPIVDRVPVLHDAFDAEPADKEPLIGGEYWLPHADFGRNFSRQEEPNGSGHEESL